MRKRKVGQLKMMTKFVLERKQHSDTKNQASHVEIEKFSSMMKRKDDRARVIKNKRIYFLN